MKPPHIRSAKPYPSRIWQTCAESPFEIPVALYLGIIGFIGLASGNGITPKTIDAALPIWLVLAWTVGLAVGGVATVIGKIMQRGRIESSGLILLAYGASLYALVLGFAADWPTAATAVAAMMAIAIGCLIRLRVLALSRRALTVADSISQEGGE